MKLIVSIIFLYLFYNISLLSYNLDSSSNKSENFMAVQMLINIDLFENQSQIFERSKDLTTMQRMYLYSEKNKSWVGPFILNLIFNFGIGSWVQGDNTGGLLGTLGGLGGLMLALSDKFPISKDFATFGLIAYLAYSIYGLIRPWIYSSSYNNTLKVSLRMNEYSNLSILPSLKLSSYGNIYPALAVSIKLDK